MLDECLHQTLHRVATRFGHEPHVLPRTASEVTGPMETADRRASLSAKPAERSRPAKLLTVEPEVKVT